MNLDNRVIEIKTPLVQKIKLWATGIGSYYILTWAYDYIVVSFLLFYFGILKGGLIVLVLSMIVDFITIKIYDHLKKDWLALEAIKDLESKKNLVGKIFHWVHGRGAFLTVIILSLLSNAFVVTAYMRKGVSSYNGMSKRDWVIFISSSILINIYWIFIVGSGIEIIKYIKGLLF